MPWAHGSVLHLPSNQSLTRHKLLKLVDLTSYKASTRTPAFATGARVRIPLQNAPKSTKLNCRFVLLVVTDVYNFNQAASAGRTGRTVTGLFESTDNST